MLPPDPRREDLRSAAATLVACLATNAPLRVARSGVAPWRPPRRASGSTLRCVRARLPGMKTLVRSLLFALTVGVAAPAVAAEKAGVKLPDSYSLDGNSLVLNGLGLREATIFAVDVYVAGLYVPSKTKDASQILKADVPKHLTMKFVRDVGRDKQVEAWREGFKKNAKDYGAIEAKVEKLLGWMADISDGESMSVSYVPGTGTSVSVKGEKKGTIEGEDFQYALFRIYIGPNPPNDGLKTGLLGME
jgi:hypothetical protein